MNNNQSVINIIEESRKIAFFREKLNYLVVAIKQCLSEISDSDSEFPQGREKVVNVIRGLQTKIHFFCSSNINNSIQLNSSKECPLTNDQLVIKRGYDFYEKLQSEFRRERRRSLKVIKANLRLKKKARKLKTSLRQLKNRINSKLELTGSKIQKKLLTISQRLDSGFEEGIKRMNASNSLSVDKKLEKKKTAEKTQNSKIDSVVNESKFQKLHGDPKVIQTKEEESQAFESAKKSQKKIDEMKLKIKLVKDLKEEGIIGKGHSLIAMKNQNSGLIITMGLGFKLVENGNLIASGRLGQEAFMLQDIIYIPTLNSYIVCLNNRLLIKGIDFQPFYPYQVGTTCPGRPGANLRYSKVNNKLFATNMFDKIAVIDPQTRKIEMEAIIVKESPGRVIDFKIMGRKQNKVISVTETKVIVTGFNFTKKTTSELTSFELKLIKSRYERAVSVAICDKNQYVFVDVGIKEDMTQIMSSRVFIFKLILGSFIEKGCIDLYNLNIGETPAVRHFGNVGTHVLWVGMSWSGDAFLYDYDAGTGEFRELKEKRVKHQEKCPLKLQLVGDQFFYTGDHGRVMTLSRSI